MQPFEEAPPPELPAPPVQQDWRRLHFASPILNSVTTALRFWPLLLITVVDQEGSLLRIMVGGGLLIAFAVEAARYMRFDYRLAGTTLVVRSGVVVRRTRTVPADRVQQVSRNEKLRHRLFGVAELSVEVAGAGSEPDIKLSVVRAAEAERIGVRLQDARRALGAAPPEPDRIVYRQPNHSLFRWAAFASPLFTVPAIGAAIGALEDAIDLEEAWGWLPDGGEIWFLVGVALFGLAGATAINVARFYDMRLVQADTDLRLDYGLLTRRKLELPPNRIQALVLKLSPAGRLSATIGITVHNASSAGDATNSYLPAIPRVDRRLLIDQLVPGIDVAAPIRAHPRAALYRSLIRWTWPMAVAALAIWAGLQTAWAGFLLLALIPAAALGTRAWRVLGHGETADVVVARRGAIRDHTAVIRKARVQSVSVASNWFQRRRQLATLRIQVAQPLGSVSIRDMAAADASDLALRLARRGRSSAPSDEEAYR
jgi:putative membrane protein